MKCLRESGGVVNSAIVMAEGIVSHNSNLLQENGKGTLYMGQKFLESYWLCTSTKAKVSVAEFDAYKAQFVFDVTSIIEMEDIPPDLVINWDHTTGIHYVPVSNWTLFSRKRI